MKRQLTPAEKKPIIETTLAEAGIFSFIVFCFGYGYFGLFWLTVGSVFLFWLLWAKIFISYRFWKARRKLPDVTPEAQVLHDDVVRKKR